MSDFDIKKIAESENDENFGKETEVIRKKVEKARQIQNQRYINKKYKTNATQTNKSILENSKMTKEAKEILNISAEKLKVSPRGYFKIIKVARTIADLNESENVEKAHILEAVSFRRVSENL
jgi:magnesium chelatase family protein